MTERQKLKPFSIWQGIPSRHEKVEYTRKQTNKPKKKMQKKNPNNKTNQKNPKIYCITFPPIWRQVGQNTHVVMFFTHRAGLDSCVQLWAPTAGTRP